MLKRKKIRIWAFEFRDSKGYTMVELLVALLMAGIVMSAIYNLFIVQNRSQWLQDQIAEMQANARVAIEKICYDLRMAGFGMIGGLQVGYATGMTAPIAGTDGGAANPDQITIYYAPENAADCGVPGVQGVPDLTLALGLSPAASEAKVTENLNSPPQNLWSIGFNCGGRLYSSQTNPPYFKAIIICDSQHGGCDPPKADVVVVTAVVGADSVQTRPRLNDFPVNSTIKFFGDSNFNGYTYRIDRTDPAHPKLLRYSSGPGDPDTDVFADNIEDLQLVYITNTGAEVHGTGAITVSDIRAVRISILARTEHEDPQMKLNVALDNRRPALENRAGDPAGTHDGYHRRILTSEVQVRNFGI
jgi:prepilin-type N-terminal cleavage/methylation domain-containing protein